MLHRRNRSHSKRSGIVAIIVFVLFVGVSGYALAATEHTDNPFDQISYLSDWISNGDQLALGHDVADGQSPTFKIAGSEDTVTTSTTSSASGTGHTIQLGDDAEDEDDAAFNIADTTSGDSPNVGLGDPEFAERNEGGHFGDVFYNLWFISAVTAIVIVTQKSYQHIAQQIKRWLTPATSIR